MQKIMVALLWSLSGSLVYAGGDTSKANQTVQVVSGTLTTVTGGQTQGPAAVAVAGGFAYVCNFVGKSISVINTTSNAIVKTLTDASLTSPYNIATYTTGGSTYAYVCNVLGEDLTILNLGTQEVVATFNIGEGQQNIAVDETNHKAYVLTAFLEVIVLDLTNPIAPTVIEAEGFRLPFAYHFYSIAVYPSSKVYVGGSDSDRNGILGVVDISTPDTPVQNYVSFLVAEGFYGIRAIGIISPTKLYIPFGNQIFVTDADGAVTTTISDLSWKALYALAFDSGSGSVSVTDFGFQNAPIPPRTPVCPGGFVQQRSPQNVGHRGNFGGGGASGTTVSIIDTTTDTVSQILDGFYCPQAIALTASGFYVCDGSLPTFSCQTSSFATSLKRTTLFPSKPGMFSSGAP